MGINFTFIIVILINILTNSYLFSNNDCPPVYVRTLDGSCNNISNPEKGVIGGNFIRLTDSGFIDPETAPNARFVSNELLNDPNDLEFPFPSTPPIKVPSSLGINALLNIWGELFIFEAGQRESSLDPTGSTIIPLPENDQIAPFLPGFPGLAVTPTVVNGTKISEETGEEVLLISSPPSPWIQAEQIYPTDQEALNNMRSFEGGKLKIRPSNLVPTFVDSGNPIRVNAACALFQGANSPDIGTPCIPNTAAFGFLTLFWREHNRYASIIEDKFPWLPDEIIFSIARRHVIATVQRVFYYDILPKIIGKSYAKDVRSEIQQYDSSLDPTVTIEFNTAIQFGHDTQQATFALVDENNQILEKLTVLDTLFLPDLTGFMEGKTAEYGEDIISLIIRGLITQPAFEMDGSADNVLRNIFLPPQVIPGGLLIDAVTTSLQRQRENGMANYHRVREVLGIPIYGEYLGCPVPADETSPDPIACFEVVTPYPGVAEKLQNIYGRLDKVDLMLGGILEGQGANRLVGETFSRIIMEQAIRFGKADRQLEIRGIRLYLNRALNLKKLIELNTNVEVEGNALIYND